MTTGREAILKLAGGGDELLNVMKWFKQMRVLSILNLEKWEKTRKGRFERILAALKIDIAKHSSNK